jgi:hypothetical protein
MKHSIAHCWPLQSKAEASTSLRASAACYRKPENISVLAVVILELGFGNIEREILGRNLVIAANDTALKQAPKALNRLGVDRADNVLLAAVDNAAMIVGIAQKLVAVVFVGSEKADLLRNHGANELFHDVPVRAIDNAGHNIALTLHSANDNGLPALTLLILGVSVAVVAADESFVHFNNAHKLAKIFLCQSSSNAMAHTPSGAIRTEAHLALYLEGAYTLLDGQHEMDDAKPVPKVFVCVLEDRSAEAIALCRRRKAKLAIAKLDRLSRNLAFIATLMESGVEFVAAAPHANKLTIHILAAVAQNEREMIAARTKAVLAAAKARGVRLGSFGADFLAHANRQKAEDMVRDLAPIMADLLERRLSAHEMARELNAGQIRPARGDKWHPATVLRVLRRLGRVSPY